jgi:hypothetical protein
MPLLPFVYQHRDRWSPSVPFYFVTRYQYGRVKLLVILASQTLRRPY